MKTTITTKDQIDNLPNSEQGKDIQKMLTSPLSIGSSQYMVTKLTYDDGINERGETEDFPSVEISAVFLSGSLRANAEHMDHCPPLTHDITEQPAGQWFHDAPCSVSALDVCCGSRMFWFDRNDPRVTFVDKRRESHILPDKSSAGGSRKLVIDPDIQADFTALPFADDTFSLVVFDPPHLIRNGKKGWLAKKYGKLEGDWKEELRKGFAECFRVLHPAGTLIFKWNEHEVPVSQILALTPERPLLGNRCGKTSKSHWIVFSKPNASDQGHSPASPCSTLLDDGIHTAATIIIAGFAANGRRNPDWIKEAERIIRREVEPWLSGWVLADDRRPKDGDWVLHTYAGVRAPEYGLYRDARFWRHDGPESFPTTHWLSVPMIDLSNAEQSDGSPQRHTDTH